MSFKNIFALSALLLCLEVFSITPGYMGRRLHVFYGGNGMPMTGAIYNRESVFDFNIRQQFGVEYVLGKSRTIMVYADWFNDYLTLHDEEGYTPGPQLSLFYGWSWFIGTRRFAFKNRGSIAPLGWYRTCSFGISNVKVSDNGKYFASGRTDLGHTRTGVFVFGFGKSTVLWDRITFDGGTRFGLAFAGAITEFLKETESYGMDEVTRKASTKVFASYVFSLHVTMGYLVK